MDPTQLQADTDQEKGQGSARGNLGYRDARCIDYPTVHNDAPPIHANVTHRLKLEGGIDRHPR